MNNQEVKILDNMNDCILNAIESITYTGNNKDVRAILRDLKKDIQLINVKRGSSSDAHIRIKNYGHIYSLIKKYDPAFWNEANLKTLIPYFKTLEVLALKYHEYVITLF